LKNWSLRAKKRDRVDQLEIGLRELENSFDREFFESRREAVRAQIRRFELLLGSARRERERSRETLESGFGASEFQG